MDYGMIGKIEKAKRYAEEPGVITCLIRILADGALPSRHFLGFRPLPGPCWGE